MNIKTNVRAGYGQFSPFDYINDGTTNCPAPVGRCLGIVAPLGRGSGSKKA